jgi:hypothetical protein
MMPERMRLAQAAARRVPWYRWGPYLSERQWGTVREDYSANGDAWNFFPHDHARSRAYRWGEDGLLGISDDQGLLCFALALWNGQDCILKERLFGLSGPDGNHGEDVKEYYYYLDATPTHSYMRALYKYPQRAFPYEDLLQTNRARGRAAPEYELLDTGIFAEHRYFDVEVEYAKAGADDILIQVTARNRGPDPATLHLVPTLWFRNTWSWGNDERRPSLRAETATAPEGRVIHAMHHTLGNYWLAAEGEPHLLFTENETNNERLWQVPNRTPYVKDGIGEAVVHGALDRVNPAQEGTKAAVHYRVVIPAGEARAVRLRLTSTRLDRPFADFAAILQQRQAEADEFFTTGRAAPLAQDEARVHRQALAGLLWSKQFYQYDVERWLAGDPICAPPPQRLRGRNTDWWHLNNADIISMPDKWEYPWYAAWDLAFHCIALALVDATFAKRQLTLLLREWYMHPNGQLPAYEWAFSDVNPPVHAWAALRVYQIDRRLTGRADRTFLERVFHKLLLNFTWWVNRKDREGNNVFEGGFLGLDNIGVFDRSAALPTGGHLEQADGTAWMGMYCLNMLAIALELARENSAYEDTASKFLEHFLYIAGALNDIAGTGIGLWNEEDEFFYDVLHLPDGTTLPLRLRSLVGLIPLLAVETIEPDLLEALPHFRARLEWFLTHKPHLAGLVSRWQEPGMGERRLFALVRGHRMKRLLKRMLDPSEFLSDHGIRSLSRYYDAHPYRLEIGGMHYTVRYEAAESGTALFGGNSNWRGPVWFPLNYLLIEALQKFHHYYGDDFLVEYPSGSGEKHTIQAIATSLAQRLIDIFLRGPDGRRPVFGNQALLQEDPYWRDHLMFYEYFHGDTGAGVGAGHQTGWTALVANLFDHLAH